MTAGLPKYIPSASANPNPSFRVMEGKQKISQAYRYDFLSESEILPKNSILGSSLAIAFSSFVSSPDPATKKCIFSFSNFLEASIKYFSPLYGTCRPIKNPIFSSLCFFLISPAHAISCSVIIKLLSSIVYGRICFFPSNNLVKADSFKCFGVAPRILSARFIRSTFCL